jgi:hypothetical protein
VGLAIFILLAISKVSLIPTDQIALILGFSSFVSTKLSNYATHSDFVLSSKDILLYMLVAASLYKNKYLSNYQSVTLGLVSCGLIVSIISIDIPMLFFRIRSYFTSFEIIAIPLSIQMLFAKSRYRALLMLILYSLFSFVYSYSAISFIGSIYDRGFHYYFFHLL